MKNNISGQIFSANPAHVGVPSFDARPPANASGTYNCFVGADAVAGMPRLQSNLMTRREAATYLGITEHTLAVWKSSGRYSLPCVKLGRLVRYRQSDLDALVAKNLNLPPSLE